MQCEQGSSIIFAQEFENFYLTNIGCYKARFLESRISRSLEDGHVQYVDIVGKALIDILLSRNQCSQM
jgi:hypothetical protein